MVNLVPRYRIANSSRSSTLVQEQERTGDSWHCLGHIDLPFSSTRSFFTIFYFSGTRIKRQRLFLILLLSEQHNNRVLSYKNSLFHFRSLRLSMALQFFCIWKKARFTSTLNYFFFHSRTTLNSSLHKSFCSRLKQLCRFFCHLSWLTGSCHTSSILKVPKLTCPEPPQNTQTNLPNVQNTNQHALSFRVNVATLLVYIRSSNYLRV